jgi:hypothetical protein
VPYTKFVLHNVEEEVKVFSFVSPYWETGYCIWPHQPSSWYFTPNYKKSASCKDLPHFHKVDFKGEQSWWGMPITFITLKMVFVHAWTIGDASSLSSQLLQQVHFVCSMSRGIMTPP